MILMMYRTHEAGQPELVPLNPDFSDEEFTQFVGKVAETVKKLGRGGYEPLSVTLQVLSVNSGTVESLGKFEV